MYCTQNKKELKEISGSKPTFLGPFRCLVCFLISVDKLSNVYHMASELNIVFSLIKSFFLDLLHPFSRGCGQAFWEMWEISN